jgi:hypothetical protein
MRLLFFYAQYGTWWDRLFAWITGGPYTPAKFSQIQVEFNDGQRFGVDMKSGRAKMNVPPFRKKHRLAMVIDCPEEEIQEWLQGTVAINRIMQGGFGSFCNFWRPLYRRYRNAEQVAEAFVMAGYHSLPDYPSAENMAVWAETWLETKQPCPEDYYPPVPTGSRNAETLIWE